MTILKNDEEYEGIRASGRVVAGVLSLIESLVREGISTAHIDREAEVFIRDNGGEPAFKGYMGYPATVCASINEVVVHGVPSEKVVISEGDIIGIDVGVKMNGFYADAARTFAAGEISETASRLIKAAREGLEEGISKAVEGNRVSDISAAVQKEAKRSGFLEVRAFVGHGIGRNLHEPPEVPNWGVKGRGMVLKKGLVLAIEPMFNEGSREVEIMKDGWTAVTADRKLSAHFENTVIVGTGSAEVVT
ncbi:MAG: type I methionyl aminopeptidase [Candidatus Omnitrophota bacterium]